MSWSKKRKKNKRVSQESNKFKDAPRGTDWNLAKPFSHKMEAYYAAQGLHNERMVTVENQNDNTTTPTFVPCETMEEKEEERQRFMTSMSTVLPASFRFGQNLDKELREQLELDLKKYVGEEMEIEVCQNACGQTMNMKNLSEDENKEEKQKELDNQVTTSVSEIEKVEIDNKDKESSDTPETTEALAITTIKKKIAPVKALSYIPHGYQLSIDKKTIRRNPSLEKFHNWLKIQTEAGFITRQETVSMIPPVVLNVESHHTVLDMCAAPGSKTTQILEIVGKIQPGELEPKGFVVANDSDAKRAYLLTHQLKRLNNPACFITSSYAQFWPMIGPSNKNIGQEGIFDRVLCDVPCSGDGTARKNMGIWRFWTTLGAFGLHTLQLSIALNGARLTKVGGFMCYSTCSLNPIENEAVVAELLRLSNGSLELVDRRTEMDGIISRNGWSEWKVIAEAKGRKDQKNYEKKNNAKMQQRRKEWAAKQKKEEEAKKSSTGDGEEGEREESTEDTPMADSGINDKKVMKVDKKEPWVSIPPSWDEETLLKRCEELGMKYYDKFESVPLESRRRIRESCFPPTKEEAETFNLHKCFRTLPQDQNTGGFFTALFRKKMPLSERAKRMASALAKPPQPGDTSEANAAEDDTSACKKVKMNNGDAIHTKANVDADATVKNDTETRSVQETAQKTSVDNDEMKIDNKKKHDENEATNKKNANDTPQNKTREKGDDDFVQVQAEILPPLMKFYGLPNDFAEGRFMTRKGGSSKVLHFITENIKRNLIDQNVQGRVKIINAGLKAFERGNRGFEVSYRPCQEAIHFIAPYMNKRKVIAEKEDFQKCINTGTIKIDQFSDEFANSFREFSVGGFVVALKGYERDIAKKMFLIMWKARSDGDGLNCFVTKAEQDGIKSKLKSIA